MFTKNLLFILFTSIIIVIISHTYYNTLYIPTPQYNNNTTIIDNSNTSRTLELTMDPSILSNPHEAKVDSLKLVVYVDFKASSLVGYVDVTATLLNDTVSELILDTNHLNIQKVTDLSNNAVDFKLGAKHDIFGVPLHISIEPSQRGANKVFKTRVHYNTTKNSTALQWLEPQQTVGKKFPYLFSQCEAIHARSLVPCQDSPSNKIKYYGEITVDKPFTVLLNAIPTNKTETADGKLLYSYEQEIPIPTYLIAIVVGNLDSRKIGPRSHVWSEPEVVEAGAFEFANTEKFISIGEELLIPYPWKIYDLIVLPPSFPFGGMEGIRTLVTPTLLAGDRSLENVIAHEIAHSWCGNLVTNKYWSEFFLNEGFTVFVERKIIARMSGSHNEDVFQFEAINGLQHLADDIEVFGADNALTALRPKLDGVDPDDAFSSVPYEKGFNLLCYLQGLVGIKDFEAWLKVYIGTFQFQSITSQQMKDSYVDYFTKLGKVKEISVIDWDGWFNKPGMPLVDNKFQSTLAEEPVKFANEWVSKLGENVDHSIYRKFNPQQILKFLDQILTLTEDKKLPTEVIEKLDQEYKLTESKNAEYRAKWYTICLRHNVKRIEPHVVSMVTEQGRMKFVRPLYRELNKVNRELAVSTFNTHRNFYHAICGKMACKDLGLDEKH